MSMVLLGGNPTLVDYTPEPTDHDDFVGQIAGLGGQVVVVDGVPHIACGNIDFGETGELAACGGTYYGQPDAKIKGRQEVWWNAIEKISTETTKGNLFFGFADQDTPDSDSLVHVTHEPLEVAGA